MKAYTIRQIEDETYESLKRQSRKQGLSLNKFILDCLKKITGKSSEIKYHDLDEFIGTMSKEDAEAIDEVLKDTRKIDKEMWK